VQHYISMEYVDGEDLASPTTADVSAPYFTIGLIPIFVVLALAVYGFRTALAGQAVFRDDLLGVGAEARR